MTAIYSYEGQKFEQVLCAKEVRTGKLLELMLIKTPVQLEGFCAANGISPEEIERVY